MAKYGKKTQQTVGKVLHEYKHGELHAKSRRQAIAIGLSEARQKGEKVPPPPKNSKSAKTRSGKSR